VKKVSFVDISGCISAPGHTDRSVLLHISDLLICSYSTHASVGFTIGYEIADPAIMCLKDNDSHYMHPEAIEAGMCGADEEQGLFRFEACAAGSTTIKILQYFRGDPFSDCTVTVTIE